MKKLFLLLATFGLLATACESNQTGDQNGNGGGSSPKIELSKTKRCVASTSGEYAIMVTSPYQWEAVSKNNNWIIVESASGIAGSEELRFRVEANESDEVRKGTIVVYSTPSNLVAELSVVQAAKGQSLEDLEEEENKNDNNGGNGSGNNGDGNGGTGGNNGGNNGDGNGGNGGGSGTGAAEKKLVKMVADYGRDKHTTNYSYDDRGRLISLEFVYESIYGNNETEITQYEWSDNAVKAIYQGGSSTTYTLSDGLLQSFTERGAPYSVNCYYKGGRLDYIVDEATTTYTWEGDKLTSINSSNESTVFTYSGTCQKGYNPLIGMFLCGDTDLLVANPDLIGARTKQLFQKAHYEYVSKEKSDKGGYDYEETIYSYEFNSEGYISKITTMFNGEPDCVTTLTWE